VIADPRIGTELAGYRIEALIGRGASGGVYLAEHVRLGRKVALKILSPELAADDVFRQRFIRESRLAAELDHPGIVTVYDAGEQDGIPYLSMRLVEGTDLATVLGHGPLDTQRAVRLISQVAEALDAAHERGLVHRDVKPANILLAPAPGSPERAFLSDFGIAKRAGALRELTRTGYFVGTVDYVAPEQIRGEEIDRRADQYSLACVLYHCLIGEAPFTRPSAVAVIYAHLNDEPPRPSSLRADLPVGLDAVLERGLAKEPDARFPSCTALAVAASSALHGRRSTIATPRAGARPRAHSTRARRARRVAIAAGALLLASAIVVAVALSTITDDPDDGPSDGPSVVSAADLTWTRADGGDEIGGRGDQAILRAVVTPSGIVAIGYRGTDGDIDPAVFTSDDGEAWDGVASDALTADGVQWATGIVLHGDRLVVVGFDETGGDRDPAVWISHDDGVNWDRVPLDRALLGPGDEEMRRVVVVGDELVAVGYDANASGRDKDMAVWTSPDGEGWRLADTLAFAGPEAQEAKTVAVLEGRAVAAGFETSEGDQDAAVWRFDGAAWVQVSDPEGDLGGPGNQRINEMVAGGPGLVAVGVDDSGGSQVAAVWVSEDGVDWSPAAVAQASGADGDQVMLGVTVFGSELVAVGTDSSSKPLDGAVWTSANGVDWTRVDPGSRLVTALGGTGRQYAIEILEFEGGLVAFGREGKEGGEDAAVWLAAA
jgi:serine/threonine-protein kinase